jgi:hypothetical protein
MPSFCGASTSSTGASQRLAKREFLTIKFPALAFDAWTDGRAYITPHHRQRAERWAAAELPGRLAAPQVRRILRWGLQPSPDMNGYCGASARIKFDDEQFAALFNELQARNDKQKLMQLFGH